MAEKNKVLIQRLYEEVFNQGNLAVLDEIMSEDFLDHAPLEGQLPGREGFRQSVALGQLHAPGIRFTLKECIAEGDLVAIHIFLRRPHQGKEIQMTGMGFFRCHEGKIAEAWWNMDKLKSVNGNPQ